MNKLPNWIECREAIKSGEASNLQKFIYEQEPADIGDEDEFRTGLLAVINEIKGNQNE